MDFRLGFVRGNSVLLEPHPDSCEPEDLDSVVEKTDGPVAVDLFCGAGGLSQGLEDAGFSVIMGVDNNPESLRTHRHYFGGASICEDLSDHAVIDQICRNLEGREIDLIAGSPPCQSFSIAGRNKIRSLVDQGVRPSKDHRTDLWRGFVQIVDRVKPKTMLMENVPDLAFGLYTPILRQIVSDLEDIGYEIHARILSSGDYGVPQHRHRLFIVGVRKGLTFNWPEPEVNKEVLSDAISDLPVISGGDSEDPKPYAGPKSPLQIESRKQLPEDQRSLIFDHVSRRVRKDDLLAYRIMNSKTQYGDLPAELRRYRKDIFEDKYKMLNWDEFSRTITAHIAKDGYWYIHPDQHRTLTVREAARIQTFPDRWRFSGYQTSAFRQIGEAVPPRLARAIGSSVIRSLRGPASTDVPDNPADSEARSSAPTTYELSVALGDWVKHVEDDTLGSPWRLSGDMWQVYLGVIVFEGMDKPTVRNSWKTYARRWPEPEDFLGDDLGEAALIAIGQGPLYGRVRDLAEILASSRNDPLPEIPVDILPPAKVAQANILCDRGTDFPVFIGAIRAAARIHGFESWDTDAQGRLGLARALGAHCDGKAYGALLEIADQFCMPAETRCEVCPLQTVCVTGKQPRKLETNPVLL